LSDEIEQAQAEKKKQQRKMKRIKDKIKKKEVDLKKQEENEKQRFLSLPDTEKVRNVSKICHFVDDRKNIRYGFSLSSLVYIDIFSICQYHRFYAASLFLVS